MSLQKTCMQISKAGQRAHAPVTMSFIDNSPKLETSNVHLHVKRSVNYAMFLQGNITPRLKEMTYWCM